MAKVRELGFSLFGWRWIDRRALGVEITANTWTNSCIHIRFGLLTQAGYFSPVRRTVGSIEFFESIRSIESNEKLRLSWTFQSWGILKFISFLHFATILFIYRKRKKKPPIVTMRTRIKRPLPIPDWIQLFADKFILPALICPSHSAPLLFFFNPLISLRKLVFVVNPDILQFSKVLEM